MLSSLLHLYRKLYRRSAAGHEILEAKKHEKIRLSKKEGMSDSFFKLTK